MPYQHKCQICGCTFTDNYRGNTIHCLDCKKIANRINKRNYDARCYGSYIVVYDPDPIAGLIAGLKISREEQREMLRMSCFTPGTLLKSAEGDCFEVVQRVTKQALVEHEA